MQLPWMSVIPYRGRIKYGLLKPKLQTWVMFYWTIASSLNNWTDDERFWSGWRVPIFRKCGTALRHVFSLVIWFDWDLTITYGISLDDKNTKGPLYSSSHGGWISSGLQTDNIRNPFQVWVMFNKSFCRCFQV